MDKTIPQSPMKTRTKSKSRKVVIPEAQMCSDSEDQIILQQPSKRNNARPAPLRGGEGTETSGAAPTGSPTGCFASYDVRSID